MNLFWKVTNKVYFWAAVYLAFQFPAIGIPILLIEIYIVKYGRLFFASKRKLKKYISLYYLIKLN